MENESFSANITTLEDVTTDTVANIYLFIILACICLIILVNIVGNTGTIAAFVKIRSLHEKPSDLLILNLSIADLGLGLMQLYFLPALLKVWPWGEIGCKLNRMFY